jgi:hypothetical protein
MGKRLLLETKEPFNANADYGYNATQWPVVNNDLKSIGIDITTTVPFDRLDDQQVGGEPVHPLGDVLQYLASYFGAVARLRATGNPRPTPRRHAETAKKTLAVLKAARAAVNGASFHDEHDTLEQWRARSSSVHAVRGDLTDLIPQLEQWKERCEKLAGKDGRRRHETLATHTEYWLALMQLWRVIQSDRRQHKHLKEFLSICSKPLFPALTTEKKLISFIERYFPHQKS